MTSPDPIQPAWLPGNDIEAELVTAMAADDREAFFRIIRDSPWYLPAFPEEAGGRRFMTHELLGETYLLVYTSEQSLAGAVGALVSAYTVTGFAELAAHWPDPAWRLAVNAGTPVDAWVTPAALAEAADGERVVPSLARIAAQSDPESAGDPHLDAVLDDFLAELNRTIFVVPVTADDPPRCAVARDEDGPVVEAFTSAEALAARHPQGVAWAHAGLADLLDVWPGEDCALLVDPGSDLPLRIPGPDLPGLLLWGPGAASPEIANVEYIDQNDQRGGERGDKRDGTEGTSGLGESAFRGR